MLPEDLIEYGLIPEFIGRLPVITAIHQLSRDDLTTILTEPKNALTRQFQRFFEFDDIELVFAEDSLEAIADKAIERETGARGLRSILEETLLDVQFELPSRRDVTKCVVTRETIVQGRRPTLVTEAAQQDIGPADEDSARKPPSPGPSPRTTSSASISTCRRGSRGRNHDGSRGGRRGAEELGVHRPDRLDSAASIR